MADESDARQAAIKRLRERRAFTEHVVSYVVVNLFLILIWAITGMGYFWPIWVLGGWGVGLALHAWSQFGRRPITEEDIQREIKRGGADL